MKITVLTILILLLVAGLAMIQMDANTEDANTENQVQVLRETEMLTTQGLGTCQVVVNRVDLYGECRDIECKKVGYMEIKLEDQSQPERIPIYGKQTAIAHNQCGGFSWTTDCVPNPNAPQVPCATTTTYLFKPCDAESWPLGSNTVYRDAVQTVPGCPFEPGGGGGTVVGTSS